MLLGSSGNDTLLGDPATDILIRGAGKDVLDSGRDNILIQSSAPCSDGYECAGDDPLSLDRHTEQQHLVGENNDDRGLKPTGADLPSCRRERDSCRRRQAPQHLPKRRDLCAETQEPPLTNREKPAENGPFRRQVFHGEFRQGSNLGPTD